MKYVYLQRKGDSERIKQKLEYFKEKTNKELIESYNQSVRTGIVGVHAQALHLIALQREFNGRFKKSPVLIEEHVIISLTGKIRPYGESYTHLRTIKLILNDSSLKEVNLDAIIPLDSKLIDLKPYIQEGSNAVLIMLEHSGTILNLTEITPYVLIFFDDDHYLSGVTYSVKSGDGCYTIQTRYKTILFLKSPNDIKLTNIKAVHFET